MVFNPIASSTLDIQRLLAETPLYQFLDITLTDPADMLRLILFSDPVDIYCVGCKRMSVFQGTGEHPRQDFESENYLSRRMSAHQDSNFAVTLSCTRIERHRHTEYFMIRDMKLVKVGQFPSLADLALPDIDKYSPFLIEEEREGTLDGL